MIETLPVTMNTAIEWRRGIRRLNQAGKTSWSLMTNGKVTFSFSKNASMNVNGTMVSVARIVFSCQPATQVPFQILIIVTIINVVTIPKINDRSKKRFIKNPPWKNKYFSKLP